MILRERKKCILLESNVKELRVLACKLKIVQTTMVIFYLP